MTFVRALCALLLLSGTALAADRQKAKPCPKGQVATTSKITGDQHCFAPAIVAMPVQPAAGGAVTAPIPVPKTK